MSYTKANYGDVDAVGGGLYFLRDELDCVRLDFSVLEADSDWSGKLHDHVEQGHEEVHYLVSGEATLVVEDKELDLEPGDAVRVSPEDTCELRNGPEESTFVIAGAPWVVAPASSRRCLLELLRVLEPRTRLGGFFRVDSLRPAIDIIGDLMARDRRSDRLALRVDGPDRTYTCHDLITTSYKVGDVLRYLGVHKGARVAVDPAPLPEPLLTFLGAAQLDAVTVFDPTVGARATVVPVDSEEAFENLPPGQKLAVSGGPPNSSVTTHWEQKVWSENPAVHPEVVSPADPAFVVDDREFTHGGLLDAAREVVADFDLEAGDTVAVRSSLSHPGTVVAGALAPFLVGGTTRIPVNDEAVEAVLAAGGGVLESVALAPNDVW